MAYAFAEQTWSTRKLVGLLATVAVNVGFIALLANGLNFRMSVFKPQELQVVDVETTPVVEEEPAPPPPDVETAPPEPLDIPLPEIELPAEPQPDPIVAETNPAPAVPTETTVPADRELQADSRYPLTPPIYPSTSRRNNEQGTVLLMIYVLADGRIGDVKVGRSSGFPRLDQAAIEAARKNWRFQPATQNGTAVAAWGQYAVKFQLTTDSKA